MSRSLACLVCGLFVCGILTVFPVRAEETQETVGKRPYEMVDAGRNTNPQPPLLDFENLDGWTLETTESEATFQRTREQQLWGDYVVRLDYKYAPTEKKGAPLVTLKPPKPLPVPPPFDCVDFWVYGNNWEWVTDPTTPRVQLALRFQGKDDKEQTVHLTTVRWKEWFLIHKKFSKEDMERLGDAPLLIAVEIHGGRNEDVRTLFFDDLSFFKEPLDPLTFEPRPKRGIKLPEGQTTGTNTGPGTLPFPNREDTILPSGQFSNQPGPWQKQKDGSYSLRAGGKGEGLQTWNYRPKTGTLDDLAFFAVAHPANDIPSSGDLSAMGSTGFGIENGGVHFVDEPKEPAELVSIKEDGNVLTARWKIGDCEVEYRFQMKGKSLIVDVRCPGGKVKEFSSGAWSGLQNPRLVQVPYLVGNGALRPCVVVADSDDPKTSFFILSQLDHTRSNASEFYWKNKVEKDGENFKTDASACSRYKPRTDGLRNDCFERLFITVSTVFDEVLPNIPNDPSPWKHVTAERVWRAHGSSNHDGDFKYWSRVHRYGVRKMLITDHESMWRDGGESFTFRTSAAPGRGGDEGHKKYTENIHGLGYIYGPYNNYTDYAPVNAYWHPDRVTRLPDGNYQSAWARCYNPKPAYAVQTEPKITEIVQEKFRFNTAYCDVHTAVSPWTYVDYDARTPGAGTFAATFYAYGEIMLHQKKIWNGPVYSEGNNHWYYSGLTDGNYAQDQAYFVHQAGLPWLVDFDLLKMHPLENNFGMGYLNMFYGQRGFDRFKDKNAALDRFLTATLAFGHTGFLAMETGFPGGIRSYFAVQQIAARYATQNVKSIRYADEDGRFLTTSEAVAADKVRLNRIRIEYEDGLTLYVNGNGELPWKCLDFEAKPLAELPPNAWHVVDPLKKLTAWSLDRDGLRCDYVDAPDYLFAEVRNNPPGTPCRFDRLLCDRQIIVLKNVDDQKRWEMIVGEEGNYPVGSTMFAVRLDDEKDADAVALDFDRKEIGKVETRYSRGMVHITPVDGAVSYLLTPKPKPAVTASSKRLRVVPGESVRISKNGREETVDIPLDTKPGTLFWTDEPLDFEVVEPYEITASYDKEPRSHLIFTIRTNAPQDRKVRVEIRDENNILESRDHSFASSDTCMLVLNLALSERSAVRPWTLRMVSDEAKEMNYERKYWLKTDFGFAEPGEIPERFETGLCQRGKEPTAMDGDSGAYAHIESLTCGGVTKNGWAIHPPYRGGVGYTFLLSRPFAVPDVEGIVFSSQVGTRDGGDASDGVLYRVFVVEPDNPEKAEILAGEILQAKRDWTALTCDLTPWRGKTIRLRLIADVGPKDNSSADWAAWAELKLAATRPSLITTLHEEPVELTYLPATDPEPLRSIEDFAKAEKVELFFDGCGMDAGDQYHTDAVLNGVAIGRLPSAAGDEVNGVWATRSVLIPPEAVKTLGLVNRLELRSEADHFKIRRFHFVATFSDGTRRGTMITDRTITHPHGWKYAEGEGVPLNKPFEITVLATPR